MADTPPADTESAVGGWVSPEELAAEYSVDRLKDLYAQQLEDWWQVINSAGGQAELSYIELERLDLIRDAIIAHSDASFW